MKKQHYAALLLLIVLDQSIKLISLYYHPTYSALGLSWVYTQNYGITLSILQMQPPFILAGIQAIIILLLASIHLPHWVKILIISGGVSNLVDRLVHGFVIDYIRINLFGFTWPAVINFADIYLTIGVIFWLYSSSKQDLNNAGIFTSGKLNSE